MRSSVQSAGNVVFRFKTAKRHFYKELTTGWEYFIGNSWNRKFFGFQLFYNTGYLIFHLWQVMLAPGNLSDFGGLQILEFQIKTTQPELMETRSTLEIVAKGKQYNLMYWIKKSVQNTRYIRITTDTWRISECLTVNIRTLLSQGIYIYFI